MMLSVSFEVNFRVRAKTQPGDTVCIVGDSPGLGNWDPQNAVSMRRETKKVNLPEDEIQEESSEDGDIWSKSLRFAGFEKIKYRYCICRLFAPDNDDSSEKCVLVKWWEGHMKPRKFCPQEAMQLVQDGVTTELDVFGNYDGIRLINWGWLMDSSEIQLQLHSDPIRMWKPKYRAQNYSIKCTLIDHSYKDATDDTYDAEVYGDSLPQCNKSELLVSVLEEGRSKPKPQTKYGSVCKQGNFLTFHAKTFDPESLGYQLDFYVNDNDSTPTHIGFCFILPVDLKETRVTKKFPITGHKHGPIGQVTIDFMLAKPLMNGCFSMKRTFQRYWKSTRKPVEVGHRGLGVSYKCKTLELVTENTIRSLQSAANHGADFVEFDVQLTKDEQAVIYHDFKVLITYRKRKREDLELFEIPVKDLTLAELQHMKLSHTAYKPEHKYEGIQDDDVDPEDLRPFPTLKRVFETIDRHTGFNLEVKYPVPKIDGSGKINDYFDLNRYVDTILKVVFENHNGRRIIFSSFDADCCTLLRLKQNVYPVLFLTQCQTTRWLPYAGPRAQSLTMATEFALSAGLLGVDTHSDIVLHDLSKIDYVKKSGLVMFVWGEDCNDKENIAKLKEHKVDGIIYDRIDCYKTGDKKSIFKIEEERKKQLLERTGTISSEETPDSGTESPTDTS